MSEPTFADRLAAVHEFPGTYTFKLIGATSSAMEDAVRAAVDAALPGVAPVIHRRASSGAKYTALTVEVEVPHVEAVLSLYERFRAIEGLTHLL